MRRPQLMITRIAFDHEFGDAIRIRGLTLTELAERAGVNIATASAAVRGQALNVRTATRLARALAAAPVVPELETWAREPCSRAPRAVAVESPNEIVSMAHPPKCAPKRRFRDRSTATENQTHLELK